MHWPVVVNWNDKCVMDINFKSYGKFRQPQNVFDMMLQEGYKRPTQSNTETGVGCPFNTWWRWGN